MSARKLFATVAMGLALAFGAEAQTSPGSGTPSATAGKPATSAPKKGSAKKKGARKTKKKKAAPAPPPKTDVDEETRKALEATSHLPAPAAVAPAAPPAQEAATGPEDNDPPVLTHTPVTAAKKSKVLTITAHATDPSGVFGPVLYLRKKGLPQSEYIPLRMLPSRTGAPGDYALEIPAALVGVDALEYYLEVWDNAGNGPVRAGSAESPLAITVEEEKKIVVKQAEPVPPTSVTIKPKGAPPAILHTAVTQASRGQPIEINARLVGDTGVEGARVMFRHAGEKEYKSLPMGNIGGDDYTATVPAGQATADIEYYVEASDRFGNGPGRSGAPNVPFSIKVTDAAAQAKSLATVSPRTEEDEYTLTRLGLQLDAGAPGGAGVLLLFRPAWWVRLNAGLAYDVIGFGFRGGLTLAPGHFAVTPTLNLDAGHYFSGNANKFVTPSDPDPKVLAAEKSLLSNATYTFASAQIGLEFGSQRRFAFYLRGGLAYVSATEAGADLTLIANAKAGGNSTYTLGDAKFTAVLPTAGLGFLLFIY